MSKSADAFRTISEVADWLETPAHVLRFWESKFTQVKPVKRAGGRRYYRPADMRLLGGIKKLLHEDGMTIKGVQKILREQGIKHVSSLCTLSLGEDDGIEIEEAVAEDVVATVLPFVKPTTEDAEPEQAVLPDMIVEAPLPEGAAPSDEPEPEIEPEAGDVETYAVPEPVSEDPPVSEVEPPTATPDVPDDTPDPSTPDPMVVAEAAVPEPQSDAAVQEHDDLPPPAETTSEPPQHPIEMRGKDKPSGALETSVDIGDFSTQEPVAAPPASPEHPTEPSPGALPRIARLQRLTPEQARAVQPIVDRLRELAG